MFNFGQDVQLLDFTARKMKMPVGEKKKRKDKEGEKVGRRKFESKSNMVVQVLVKTIF